MTDQETIFANAETQQAQQAQAPTLSAEVLELVGEGKKYADVNTALVALTASQTHIQTLEAENAELKTKVQAGKTVDDIFNVVSNQSTQQNQGDPTVIPDAGEIVTEVVNVLDERDKAKVIADNVKLASDKLVELHGDKAKAAQVMQLKATELGVGVKFLMSVAARSPKAFMQYFAGSAHAGESGNASSDSGINTDALSNSISVKEGTKAWWSQQRREKGDAWYFSQEETRKRSGDAIRLGRDAFFGKNK